MPYHSGTSVLLKFNFKRDVLNYLKDLYVENMHSERCLFVLQVLKVRNSFNEFVKISLVNKTLARQKSNKRKTPEKRAVLSEKNKIDQRNFRARKKMCFEASESLRLKAKSYQQKYIAKKTKKNDSPTPKTVKLFKSHISKGPYYICVICNRCLYRQSVKPFVESKYYVAIEIFNNVLDYRVQSFDNIEYICKTCDSKLIKGKLPCQAVINNLEIYDLPDRFLDIRRLEKVIIAKRLL